MKKIIVGLSLIATSLNALAQNQMSKTDWFNLDLEKDGVRGMSVNRAYEELLKNKKSKKVIVAVIDSGIDTKHEDLEEVIWVNEKEIAGNGKDDDGNGFVDDINGWDFIGGADGTDVKEEQIESTRLLIKYQEFFGDKPKKRKIKKNQDDYNLFQKLKKEVKSKQEESTKMLSMYEGILTNFRDTENLLKKHLGTETLTSDAVSAIVEGDVDKDVRRAKQYWLRLTGMGANEAAIVDGVEHFKAQAKYNYNLDFNARAVVGDNLKKLEYGKYGNSEVRGPDARHGTHVAGIIGAVRNNGIGMNGVADNVAIMVLRAVPDGDERDKDVANAIRYAADNGARVINMSFGKGYSPEKKWVDEAVKYAESKGVLLVGAAGNDGMDIDETPHYPVKNFDKGGKAQNWIAVGAQNYQEKEDVVATFSNYGKVGVDIFAPGVAIYSTVPDSKYEDLQGTSMASPAVAGVAALLMSYFPDFTASEIKNIILSSGVDLSDQNIKLPGSEKKVLFGELSNTGKVINVYNAVEKAIQMSSK